MKIKLPSSLQIEPNLTSSQSSSNLLASVMSVASRDELYKNRSSGKTDSQQEKRSSGSPILFQLVSENGFSGKTYFYTIASSSRSSGWTRWRGATIRPTSTSAAPFPKADPARPRPRSTTHIQGGPTKFYSGN